jgi:hypothetical protein
VELQVQVTGGSWSPLVSDTVHTITAGEDAANQINLSLSLPNGSYDARARVTDTIGTGLTSAWSNTVVNFTISGVVTYQGPGDVVSGAVAWASCARAYTAAYATAHNAMMDLVDQAGAHPITINCLSSGFVDLTSINNWVTANSVTTIKVTKLYDQSGTGNHFTQATLANMPTLVLNIINGLPVLQFTSGGSMQINTAAISVTSPISFSTVAKRTTFNTALDGIFATQTTAFGLSFNNISGQIVMANPSTSSIASSTEGAWHSLQGMTTEDGSTHPTVVIDGVASSGGTASSTAFSALVLRFGRSPGGITMAGQITEGGVWGSLSFSPTQYANLTSNQRSATNGYNF